MDVYVAGGVDGSCVFQSTGGSSGGADGAVSRVEGWPSFYS